MRLLNSIRQLLFRAQQTWQPRGSSSRGGWNVTAARLSASARAQQTIKCRSSSLCGAAAVRVQIVIIHVVIKRPSPTVDTLFLFIL